MTIPQLPAELVQEIVQLSSSLFGSDYSTRSTHLANCRRVCQKWAVWTQVEMFRHLEFSSRRKVVLFLGEVRDGEKKELAKLTRSLSLNASLNIRANDGSTLSSIDSRHLTLLLLRALPNLKHLMLDQLQMDPRILCVASSLETLFLESTTVKTFTSSSVMAQDFIPAVDHLELPKLRQLSLNKVTREREYNSYSFKDVSLPRLSTLVYVSIDSSDFDLDPSCFLPSLKTLQYHRIPRTVTPADDWATSIVDKFDQCSSLEELSLSISNLSQVNRIDNLPTNLKTLRINTLYDLPTGVFLDSVVLPMMQRQRRGLQTLSLAPAGSARARRKRQATIQACADLGVELVEEGAWEYWDRVERYQSWDECRSE